MFNLFKNLFIYKSKYVGTTFKGFNYNDILIIDEDWNYNWILENNKVVKYNV